MARPPVARSSCGRRSEALGNSARRRRAFGSIPVFLHGVVLSVVPGTIARLIVSVTISAGAAATALGLLVFEESLGEEPSKDETRLG
jgi:hypothetical protein